MNYTTYDYARMLADTRRVEAYREAIRRHTQSCSTVIDLGSGVGLFALEAARAGAKQVVAIEPNPCSRLINQLAKRNQLSISVYQKRVQDVVLTERADILVFDVRGSLPLYGESVLALIDARERLCKEDVLLLPQRDELYIALAHCPDLYAEKSRAWGSLEIDFDFSPVSKQCLQAWYREPCDQRYFVTQPKPWATLDYATIDSSDVEGKVCFTIESNPEVHGFFLYADVHFPGGISYSCKSHAEVCLSGSAFFPFPEPIQLVDGDSIEISLDARLVGGTYVWSWNSVVTNADGEKSWSAEQNTLSQVIGSVGNLEKRGAHFSPVLGEEGRILARSLELFGGGLSLGEIAEQLCSEYPDFFTNSDRALAHVGRLSAKYSS